MCPLLSSHCHFSPKQPGTKWLGSLPRSSTCLPSPGSWQPRRWPWPASAQAAPPDIAALREGGSLDDLGGHPGIGAGCAHLRGFVPLAGQAEVGDLQGLVLHVIALNGLQQQNWGRERQDCGGSGSGGRDKGRRAGSSLSPDGHLAGSWGHGGDPAQEGELTAGAGMASDKNNNTRDAFYTQF